MIPALVLTAGLATRLRPLSFLRAKPAMPVAGEPLIRRILQPFRAAGVADVVLNLHHLPHTIAGAVGDGSDLGVRVRYSWEVPILGSAGGPRQALPLLEAATFLIANGDTLTSVDLAALVADHTRSGALVTMAVVPRLDSHKYGGVLVDESGAVTGFTKRGSGTVAAPDARALALSDPDTVAPSDPDTVAPRAFHFVGVQVAEAEAFASVPQGVPAESLRDVYPSLIRVRPGSVRAHVSDAEFLDIGTPEDYLSTSLLLARREAGAPLQGARVRIAVTARVEDSVLWDDVEVGAGSRVRRCILADGARVPPGSSWIGVTLRPAAAELAPGEQRVGELAVGPI